MSFPTALQTVQIEDAMQENTKQCSFLLHKKIYSDAAFHNNSFCSYTILWSSWRFFSLLSKVSQPENRSLSQWEWSVLYNYSDNFQDASIFKDTNYLNTVLSGNILKWTLRSGVFDAQEIMNIQKHEDFQKDEKLFWSTLLP